VDKHPGGSDFLLASVGRDATAMYESIHDEKNTAVLK
jgi:cytochrome b involved in lipid metabolism